MILILVAIFMASTLNAVIFTYGYILLLSAASNTVKYHLKYFVYVTAPLLLVLLALWGLVVPANQVPRPFDSGIAYATYTWLRILACGGAIQSLFMPLIESPSHLKDLFKKTGLGSMGVLVTSAIIFLPELKRRLNLVMDARRAQGEGINGLVGVKNLPTLLMPLVSSLLDSSNKRAELWGHRGIMRINGPSEDVTYNTLCGGTLLTLSALACLIVNII
jgi:hypothetical protein